MVNKKISNGRKEKHLRKLKRAAAKREFRHESIRQKTRHSYNKMRKCNILVLFVLFIAIIVANFWLKSLLFFVLSLVYLCPLILTHIIWVNCVEEYEGFPTPQALYEEAFATFILCIFAGVIGVVVTLFTVSGYIKINLL